MGNAKNVALWVVLFLLVLALFNLFGGQNTATSSNETTYSEFVADVKDGRVATAVIDGEAVRYVTTDNQRLATIVPTDAEVTQFLIDNNVRVRAEQQQQSGLQSFLLSLLPFAILIGIWLFFMNRMQGGRGGGGAMGLENPRRKC